MIGVVVALMAPRAAKVWRRLFLTAAIVCLVGPLSMCVGTAGLVSATSEASKSAAAGFGAAAAGGIASMVVGFFAFFLAAILLVLGLLIGRDKQPPSAQTAGAKS